MAKRHSKRYQKNLEKVPVERVEIPRAIEILQSLETSKFDSTVELVMHLGVDPRQADQNLRGAISLPNGLGKTRTVIAFCEGDDVEAA